MPKPRVSIVTPGTFGVSAKRRSSVEQVVMETAYYNKPFVDLQIIGKQSHGGKLKVRKDGIETVNIRAAGSAHYLKQAKRCIRNHRSQIIQIENRPKMIRSLKRSFPKARIWLSLHSTTFISNPYITKKQLGYQLKAAEHIWVNSYYLKNYLMGLIPSIESKITVNHLGVNTDKFPSKWSETEEPSGKVLISKLGYENKKVITYIGRLIPIKGVHHLLKALPDIAKAHPNTVLLIVGSAYYESDRLTPYVKKLHQLGNQMPQHVRFIPYIPHEEIQSYFAASDVVVVPSGDREAFGLVNVEAMASGVPVVASKVGGIREIIVEGENGLFVEPSRIRTNLSETLISLLSEHEKIKTMGKQARVHVMNHFTWRLTAERWLKLVKQKLG
jgi:spore coat protein SA